MSWAGWASRNSSTRSSSAPDTSPLLSERKEKPINQRNDPSHATETPVWFITGCSTGFGCELARQAIERGFRTDWAGRSANGSAHQIDDDRATAGRVRVAVRASSGKQPGDPVRAVTAIIEAVASGQPPHHLLLGNDAYEGAMTKLDELRRDFTAGEQVARGADFPVETA